MQYKLNLMIPCLLIISACGIFDMEKENSDAPESLITESIQEESKGETKPEPNHDHALENFYLKEVEAPLNNDPLSQPSWAFSIEGYHHSLVSNSQGDIYLSHAIYSQQLKVFYDSEVKYYFDFEDKSGRMLLLKLDPQGKPKFAKTFKDNDNTIDLKLIQNSAKGEIWVKGYFESSELWMEEKLLFTNNGEKDSFIIKFKSSGELLEQNTQIYLGGKESDLISDLLIFDDFAMIIGECRSNPMKINFYDSAYCQDDFKEEGIFLIKFDLQTWQPEWIKTFPKFYDSSFEQSKDGNLWFTFTFSTKYINPEGELWKLLDLGQNIHSGVAFGKIDLKTGEIMFIKNVGTEQDDDKPKILETSQGDFYAVYVSRDTLVYPYNDFSNRINILKLSPQGDLIWKQNIDVDGMYISSNPRLHLSKEDQLLIMFVYSSLKTIEATEDIYISDFRKYDRDGSLLFSNTIKSDTKGKFDIDDELLLIKRISNSEGAGYSTKDTLLSKYDQSGHLLWEIPLEGKNQRISCYQKVDQGYFVVIAVRGSGTIQINGEKFTSPADFTTYHALITPSGNIRWIHPVYKNNEYIVLYCSQIAKAKNGFYFPFSSLGDLLVDLFGKKYHWESDKSHITIIKYGNDIPSRRPLQIKAN